MSRGWFRDLSPDLLHYGLQVKLKLNSTKYKLFVFKIFSGLSQILGLYIDFLFLERYTWPMALKNPQNISPMGNEASQFGLTNPEQCSPCFVIANHATADSLEKARLLQEYGGFKINVAILNEKLANALAAPQEKTCLRKRIEELGK
jgi:hypothetical protein